MKQPIKDRIDILFEKAKAGDAQSQLRLARCFQKGHLVEKSTSQAQYWAFKAVSSGYEAAEDTYQQLFFGKKAANSLTSQNMSECAGILIIAELFGGGLLYFITKWLGFEDSIFNTICAYAALIGLASLFLGIVPMDKISNSKYSKYQYVFLITVTIIIHVLAIVIAIQQS